VSRRASISGIVDQADVTQPFCPGGSAHATIPFRQLPAAAIPAAAGAFGELLSRGRARLAPRQTCQPGLLKSRVPGKMMLSAENTGNFL
jgi:hypothetical protein